MYCTTPSGTRYHTGSPRWVRARQSVEEIYNQLVSDADKTADFPLGLTDGFALTQHDWLEAHCRPAPPEGGA